MKNYESHLLGNLGDNLMGDSMYTVNYDMSSSERNHSVSIFTD